MSDDLRAELERINDGRAMHGLEPLDKLPDHALAETFDASNEAQAKERQKRADLAEKKRRALVAAVMDTAQGRAWVWEMLVRCQVYAAILPTSALEMAFAEGRRSVGLFVLADVQAIAPDRYSEMVKEAARAAQ